MIRMYSVRYGPMMVMIMDKIIDIYAVNANTTSTTRATLLKNCATLSELVLKGGFVVYCCVGLFYLINPFYSYYVRNELVPMLPLYWPIYDETTTIGFSMLFTNQLIITSLTVIGIGSVDLLFIAMFVNVPVLSTIFRDNIKDLNNILREEKVNELQAKAKLRNILLMHREIWE